MNENPLTQNDIEHYQNCGYVVLREAFPHKAALAMQDFMWERLKANVSIERNDTSTWRNCTHRLNKTAGHDIYKPIGSPRLFGAFDQLLGKGTWHAPPKWGGFLVTFPQSEMTPWTVRAGDWHWDGNPAGSLTPKGRGLFLFMLFSQVEPMGGGTLIASGSHHLIRKLFQSLSPQETHRQKPLKQRFRSKYEYFKTLNNEEDPSDRIERFMNQETSVDGVPIRIIEATGSPGDVYICHPDIYHSKSINTRDTPRFMRAGGPRPNP